MQQALFLYNGVKMKRPTRILRMAHHNPKHSGHWMAGNWIALLRILRLKDSLQAIFTSSEFN